MAYEQTIRGAVECEGVGLHSGAPVHMRILPAAAGTGIVFRRVDLDGFLVEADSGRLQVRGCSFGSDEPGIALRAGLQHAIIAENNGVLGVEIANEIGERAVLANNEPPPQPSR